MSAILLIVFIMAALVSLVLPKTSPAWTLTLILATICLVALLWRSVP